MDELMQGDLMMGGEPPPPEAEEVRSAEDAKAEVAEARKNLVKQIVDDVKGWEKHHEKFFKAMRDDARFVANKGNEQWKDGANCDTDAYVANVTHRFIQQKVASLYAKNPRVKAERRPSIDFVVWDGRAETLQSAMMTMTAIQQGMQAMQMANNGMPGAIAPPQPMMQPMMDAGTATAIIAEVTQARQKRDTIDKIGRTAAVLFHYFIDESRPRFKTQMKQAIRRAATCGVAYVQLDFERKFDGHKPETETAIRTTQDQIKNMMALADTVSDGDVQSDDPRIAELQLQVDTLASEPDMIVREGPVFDFPKSWDIIPDDECKQLVGWVGCKKLARAFCYTVEQIKARFNVDLKEGEFSAYTPDPRDHKGRQAPGTDKPDVVRWWEVYDSTTGLMYSVADGYCDFLSEPGPPRVKVEQFFPFYPIVLNEVENDEELSVLSDTELLRPQQKELNRTREALRQHRIAASPFTVIGKDKLSEEDIGQLKNRKAHDVVQLDAMQQGQKVGDVFMAGPTPTLDPNIYTDEPIIQDMLRIGGAQEANLGPTAGNTATEAGIAESSRALTSSSNVDDINDVLTDLADDTCAVMFREMSLEMVQQIAGPGAIWPDSTAEDYIAELSLKVVAGSMGKPNRDRDAAAYERIMPFAVQVPGISMDYLAKRTVSLLDESADMEDAIMEGVPSVLAYNAMFKGGAAAGASPNGGGDAPTGDPATDPNQQGGAGAQNGPVGQGTPGGPQAGNPIGTATGPVM
jgi:hypothetical protein